MGKHIGLLVAAGSIMVACSGGSDSERTEVGWGELQSGHPIAGVPALDTDVDESALDVDDSVDETVDLDDDTLASTEDDAPDIVVDDVEKAAPIDHTSLPSQNDIESVACPNPGPNPTYGKGTQLVTTEWLHLRTGPSIQHAILTTMKPGTAVAVLDPTCGHKWVHVKDSHGEVGYSAVEWLRPKHTDIAPSGWASLYSAARGQELAGTSWKMWHKATGHGFCLRGVREAIDSSISPGFATGSPGASQFGQFARDHRGFMRNHHMTVYAFGENGPSPAHFPVGTIMVFSRGRCGADPTWGHVEIVINSTVACSDHCRQRTDTSCGPDTIILPRK
jgi:hypothetical protein